MINICRRGKDVNLIPGEASMAGPKFSYAAGEGFARTRGVLFSSITWERCTKDRKGTLEGLSILDR